MLLDQGWCVIGSVPQFVQRASNKRLKQKEELNA